MGPILLLPKPHATPTEPHSAHACQHQHQVYSLFHSCKQHSTLLTDSLFVLLKDFVAAYQKAQAEHQALIKVGALGWHTSRTA